MTKTKLVRNTVICVPGILAALFAICIVAIHTAVFRDFLGSEIRRQALEKTGVRVEIGSLEMPWSHLAVILHGLVVRGSEDGDSREPLARAKRLEVGLRLLPLLRGSVQLSDLLIDEPLIHVRIDSRGRSNLPIIRPTSRASSLSAPDRIFNLRVGDCAIRAGDIYYNDAHTPLNAELNDLAFQSTYYVLSAEYQGTFAYESGRIASGQIKLLAHSLHLDFRANRTGLSVENMKLTLGGSVATINAHLGNYANPAIDGEYRATLVLAELATATHAFPVAGRVETTGTFGYHASGSQSVAAAISVQGDLHSDKLSLPPNRSAIEATAVVASYKLGDANLQVRNIDARVLNGHFHSNVEILHIDKVRPATSFDASLQGVSLTTFSNASGFRQARRIPLAGTGDLQANGTLAGSLGSLVMKLRLKVSSSRRLSASPHLIPVNGFVQANYNGPENTVSFGRSYLQTASTKVTVTGTLRDGRDSGSGIRLAANTNDLREVASIAELIRRPVSTSPPLRAFDLVGTAALTATITGGAKHPQVRGSLTVQHLAAGRSRWRSLALDFGASPSEVEIRNGTLVSITRGQAEFSGSAGLRQWSLWAQSPIALQASLTNLSIGDLSEIPQRHYPVDGTLSGRVALSGTKINPHGQAAFTISHGSAWNETFDNLALNVNFLQHVVASTLNLKIPAGTIIADASYDLLLRQYALKVQTNRVQLAKLGSVERLADVSGALSFSANGTGTFDDPRLQANVSIPDLRVQGQTVTGLAAQLTVARQHAEVALHAGVDEGTVDAKGDVALNGAKYATASADIRSFPIAALLAQFLPAQSRRELSGQLAAHLTAQGALTEPAQMEAHLEVPPLTVKYAGAQVSLAQAVRADYQDGTLTVARTRIEGPGTNLTFGGTIPIRSSAAYSLSADGNVDLAVLQKFDPKIHSSGRMDLHLTGGKNPGQFDLQGLFSVKDAVFSSDAIPVGIEGLNAQINISGSRVDIINLSGTAGGGNISARGFFSYGAHKTFDVSLNANSVRVRYPTGLRSVLNAQVALQGTPADSTLAGRVLVDRLSFTQEFDLSNLAGFFASDSSGSSTSALVRHMKMNVAVQSSQNLNLASSKISMGGSANLRIVGTLADPILLGRIGLTNGDVFFLSKRFTVQSGTIAFANPARTDPVVNLYVKTTVEQYDVTMKLSGPVDRLRTDFTSSPSLPPADIIHLLAFGNTTEEANSQPGQSAQMGAESVLASGVSSQVAGKLENVTGLSQVTIDPLATDAQGNPGAQIAIQERVTGSILFTFSTNVTSTQYSTAEVQYQLSKKLFVSGLRDQNGGYGIDLRLHKAF